MDLPCPTDIANSAALVVRPGGSGIMSRSVCRRLRGRHGAKQSHLRAAADPWGLSFRTAKVSHRLIQKNISLKSDPISV
jgi:hypothetical protein